ncbi:MAG: serine/threonine-protein kinase [Planctomycetaceae bacterium]
MVGKYRIEKRLSEGGFAVVYQAFDTIEGIRVALKVPHSVHVRQDVLNDFKTEVRMAARLEHPNILPLKDASFIGDMFVIVLQLGERTLADRLRNRMSIAVAMEYGEQLLEAVAYAHSQKIIHCDIKPDNCILFPDNRLKLCDFGIAKVAQKTVRGGGTGTVGFMAPEQAMGKPSLRSDVFSVGLILYRMFSGEWPEWPYDWPPAGYARLRRLVHPDMIDFLKKAIEPLPRRRFIDGEQMLNSFRRLKTRVLNHADKRRRKSA